MQQGRTAAILSLQSQSAMLRQLRATAWDATAPTSALAPGMDPAMIEAVRKMEADSLFKYRGLLLVLALGYALICVLSVALIAYLRRNRTVAFRGDSSAARKVILPAYVPLLVILMAMALVYSVSFWVLRAVTHRVDQIAGVVANEVFYSMRLFFMLIVVIYLLQKSVTTPALKRATLVTLLLSTYTIPVVWLVETYASSANLKHWVPQFARMLLVVFSLWVFVFPPERASKRSLREYISFVLVYYALFFTYSELFQDMKLDEGFLFAYANILWGALCPLVIWRVLKADTEHWRGLGRRAVQLQSLFRQKHRMDERISSRGLHVLIEMHRKYIIDFAVLELKHKIGTGSSAIVFNGVLHSKTPVAVKVYSPTELTDEVVAEFSHEAALCGALHHPNIVKFYGMCVCPPTVCLVSELCQGSLDDITKAIARRAHDGTRQQLMINLNYMIDATRAVAYLHSFSPAFIHRDIKPGNFLIDRRCVVKLTDFGESRSLPRECAGQRHGGSVWQQQQGDLQEDPAMLGQPPSLDGFVGSMHASVIRRPAMTVRGTAEYMAPELIQGKAGTALYGEAADIFSLAMTLWDILYPLDDKYPRAHGNHLKVFEAVLAGQRPTFHSDVLPELADLLTRAWDPRPEHRPSALSLLTTLERIHVDVSGEVALVLANAMEKKIMISRKGCTTEHTSAGQDLVQKMLEFDIIDSIDEGVRAGNGLMSAGLLHHARHVVGFECSAEQFMFDETKLEALVYPFHQSPPAPLPPIVERRRGSSSGIRGPSPTRVDDETTTVNDDDASSAFHDHESEFSQSVGPQTTKDAEASGVAATIGELFRFGPRRKLSRAGDHNDHEGHAAASSQWTDTTGGDANVCPCKRLGAGLMYITKRGGHVGASSGINKRFRRGAGHSNKPRTASHGSFHQSGERPAIDPSDLFTTPPGGVSRGFIGSAAPTASSMQSTQSALENGLTARLLMNDFTMTNNSDSYTSPVPTPLSASDVEMGFHMADTSEDDSDDEERRHFRHLQSGQRGRSRRGRTMTGCADSNSSSTQDGSSSLESATVVLPVDLA